MQEKVEREYAVRTEKLEKISSLSFSTPVSFRFSRHQMQEVATWKDLYGGVIKHLCQKKFEQVKNALPENEIGDLKASRYMKSPSWIRRGYYVETGLATNTILQRIKDAILSCDMKLSDLIIQYYVDEEKKKVYEERKEKNEENDRVLQLKWDYTGSYKGAYPISYRFKGHRTKQVKSWNDLYAQTIAFLVQKYPRIIKDGVSFGNTRTDVTKTEKKKREMQHPEYIGNGLFLETYGTSAMLIDRLYKALILCKIDPDTVMINFAFKDTSKADEYLGKKMAGIKQNPDNLQLDLRVVKRVRFLINKYFENGYRIDSNIDRNRFDTYYQKQYKETFSMDDDVFKKILLSISTPIDGRIQPGNQGAINKLAKQISQTLSETFSAGATCIYTSKIMELFQKELADAGIHDEKSLEGLIVSSCGNMYKAQYGRICYGRKKADIENEIIEYLKECDRPQDISGLEEKFWYIPQTALERELSNADGVISLRNKSYYYASSLPIKHAEKHQIRESIKSFFTIQQAMTEMELLEVVLSICPHLLQEISFLSWRGLEDCLGYLFRDDILIQNERIVPR